MESKKTVKYIWFYKGLYIILSLKNSGGNKMRGIGLKLSCHNTLKRGIKSLLETKVWI